MWAQSALSTSCLSCNDLKPPVPRLSHTHRRSGSVYLEAGCLRIAVDRQRQRHPARLSVVIMAPLGAMMPEPANGRLLWTLDVPLPD